MAQTQTRLPDIIRKNEQNILSDWIQEQTKWVSRKNVSMKEGELKEQSKTFLKLVSEALQSDGSKNIQEPVWERVREFLSDISRSRAEQGFTSTETATFIFSLKQPLFERLRKEIKTADTLVEEIWAASELLDKLGLLTTEMYLKSRESLISRQQEEMMELSTPVVKLWDGILALPLIGTLDSERTQVVMENLLQRIVETGSSVAILDITGVPTVDTLVAQHLLKTVTAARLMGADCIISGIRPQIAQTIVHLGIDLNNVGTKSSLADAFQMALKRLGLTVTRNGTAPAQRTP